MENNIVNARELADWLGVSERRVNQLVHEKVLCRKAKAEFDLKASVKKYISYVSPKAKDADLDDDELNVQLKKEKIRLTKYQADEQKVKAETAEKQVIPVEEVKHCLAGLFALMRTKLLNVPDRAELELLGETDGDIFNKKLTIEIKDAMYEVCDGVDETIDKITKENENLEQG